MGVVSYSEDNRDRRLAGGGPSEVMGVAKYEGARLERQLATVLRFVEEEDRIRAELDQIYAEVRQIYDTDNNQRGLEKARCALRRAETVRNKWNLAVKNTEYAVQEFARLEDKGI